MNFIFHPNSSLSSHFMQWISSSFIPSVISFNHRLSGLPFLDNFKYHVFAPVGRFQLELIYLYFPLSFHLTVVVYVTFRSNFNTHKTCWKCINNKRPTGQKQQMLDGRTVENKGKLIPFLVLPGGHHSTFSFRVAYSP